MNYYNDNDRELSMCHPVSERSAIQCGATKPDENDVKASLFYNQMANKLATAQICVDVYMAPPLSKVAAMGDDYCDASTLSCLCRTTSGQFHLFPSMRGRNDYETLSTALNSEMLRSATRGMGNEAVLKIRTSQGVRIKDYLAPAGILHVGVGGAELELASFDADSSVCVALEHEGAGVEEGQMVYFQSAVLYTSIIGRRMVRVSTLAIPSSSSVQDIFRMTDYDATVNCLSRKTIVTLGCGDGAAKGGGDNLFSGGAALAVNVGDGGSFLKAREDLITDCIRILAMYRKNTSASQFPAGQLILPEALKILPLFCLCMLKTCVLRTALPKGRVNANSSPSPRVDDRSFRTFHYCKQSSVFTTLWAIPNFYNLTTMSDECGRPYTPKEGGGGGVNESEEVKAEAMKERIRLPPTVQPSVTSVGFGTDGIYLIDDGFTFYLYVGRNVDKAITGDVLNQTSDRGIRVQKIVDKLRSKRPIHQELKIVDAGNPNQALEEAFIFSLLVYDSTPHETTAYVDFLVIVHRKISAMIKK
jgi:protein transport protein SEC24